MTRGLGTERMNDLRERVNNVRAKITEGAEPYSGDDMEFEPFDPETIARVEELARAAKAK